jgi:hypothetical protein
MLAQSSHVPVSAPGYEISRVVRLSGLALELTPSQGQRILERLDTYAAFAVVVLASSGVLCAAASMLTRWQWT